VGNKLKKKTITINIAIVTKIERFGNPVGEKDEIVEQYQVNSYQGLYLL
jgi:hypothetical protein